MTIAEAAKARGIEYLVHFVQTEFLTITMMNSVSTVSKIQFHFR